MQKIKNLYHLFQAILANLWYGFPSRRLKVIGVTGTDGKTTTTHLIAHILKVVGKKVSFVSSVFASIGGKESDIGFHVTTPSSFTLQKLLKRSADNHDGYFILETTSHALDQNRVWGIKYEIGVITNITHEHLDYHGTYEKYVKAKLKLLLNSKVAVINEDDESYKLLSQKLKVKSQKYNSKVKILEELPELTKFNQYNYAAAYTVCKELGLSDEVILQALKTFELPKGRLDLVYDKDFKIIIDFAHTPNALLQLLPSIRKLYLKKGGRLIHVFGSAGLRDFTKRPLMGEASAKYSEIIYITEEDYRTEDPNKICMQIASSMNNANYKIILDRQTAINQAIKIARIDDVVVLTGKAHEKSMCRGQIEYPWDEYKAVEKALKL
ncbi:UDP-N-acetylmuramyl-tripeptide synthetase [Candidatus Roizmanbacteria bacterium]|nr:UDP-N-acetylmuramyl-tripeptide synthetase [Candidatus Roizmanbacteria bacterium]